MTELFGNGPKPVRVSGIPGTLYTEGFGGCKVLVTRDPLTVRGIARIRWHMSISRQDRYPTWDEIKTARYKLIPDEAVMVMVLPPRKNFISVHPNCFQLLEIDDADLGER